MFAAMCVRAHIDPVFKINHFNFIITIFNKQTELELKWLLASIASCTKCGWPSDSF